MVTPILAYGTRGGASACAVQLTDVDHHVLQDTFADVYNVLRHVSSDDLRELVHATSEECLSSLEGDGIKFLILVLDEAQLWAKELPGRFSNGAVEAEQAGRPLLTVFLAVIASDPVLFQFIHVVLSGTGLSLLESTLVASALMKVGSEPFPVIEFGTFSEETALKYLESYAGPQELAEADIRYLRGRRRFAVRVVLDWVQSGQKSIGECLRSLVLCHSTKAGRELCLARMSDEAYERHYLYGRLTSLLKRGAEGLRLLELLKRVAFAHARLGGPCLFRHHREFDLVDLGFAKLHPTMQQTYVASVEEPLASRALRNFLESKLKWSPLDHTLSLMAQSHPFPAMLGQCFEVVAPDQLPELFETEGALAQKPLFRNLKNLPECFQEGGASLARVWRGPDGRFRVEKVANPRGADAEVRIATKARGVLSWLQDPAGSSFFFRRRTPDLSFSSSWSWGASSISSSANSSSGGSWTASRGL
jgi:hypothetical protein